MVDLLKFFHLTNINGIYILVTFVAVAIGILMIVYILLNRLNFWANWRASKLKFFVFHPYLGRKWCEIAADEQKERAIKAKNYSQPETTKEQKEKAFKEFIMDLPVYCLEDGFAARLVRMMYSRGGARFQQVVLHDPSSVDDVYLHVRKIGDYFCHDGGVYLFPWDNSKTVLHWDINDCRPMFEKSKEAQWQNPRMGARYVYGILNSKSMKPKSSEMDNKATLILIGIILMIIIGAVGIYFQTQNQKVLVELLTNISQSVNHAPQLIQVNK